MDIVNIISHYAELLSNVKVSYNLFLGFTSVVVIIGLLRYLVNIKLEKDKKKKLSSIELKFISSRSFIELLISYVVCYLFIKLTFANPENYILNYIIAPAVGIISAKYLNSKFIIPLENESLITKKKPAKKEDDKSAINININSNKEVSSDQDNNDEDTMFKHMSSDIADSDEFNDTVVEVINTIKDIQKEQNRNIKYSMDKIQETANEVAINTEKLDETVEMLRIIKESEMMDKKVELKAMIYNCLNNGFATPEENDKITMYYNSYLALGGNGEIKALYENHYLNLHVHEDRRKYINPVLNDINTSTIRKNCEYGKYDLEYNTGKI